MVEEVLSHPERFGEVFEGMLSSDPIVRMRSADAVEKITAQIPQVLQPFKEALIERVARSDQQEVQWHVAQLISRLGLTSGERAEVVSVLFEYLGSKSAIVKVFSMQALADIAERDASYRSVVIRRLESLTRTGTAAVRNRGRRLLARLGRRRSSA